jgi:non-reducing end alpha-L-arabinofuranosidase
MNILNKSYSRLAVAFACAIGFLSASSAAEGPCDIYAKAGTPCVAAHGTTRALFAAYNGALYQVRRKSDGQLKDIGVLSPGGVVRIATQDSFLTGTTGTISIIYDQTTNHNDLKKSGKVYWLSNGGNEGSATGGQIKIDGKTAYGIYVTGNSGNVAYRNNATKGVATGNQAESMYAVVDGKRYSSSCCFDYGNAETSGNDDGNGTMEAIYWGSDVGWGGYGQGNGPWIAADLENGMFKGNAGGYQYGDSHKTPWATAKTVNAKYASLVLKGPSTNKFTIKAGDAQSGKLVTMWDSIRPTPNYSPKKLQGAIILGTGGDGSPGGTGTFYEGAMTTGNPPDSIDDKIQANIVAAGYGSTTSSISDPIAFSNESEATLRFDPANARAVVRFAVQREGNATLSIVDPRGHRIATIVDGMLSAGMHEAVWDASRVPQGLYIARLSVAGREAWSGNLVLSR